MTKITIDGKIKFVAPPIENTKNVQSLNQIIKKIKC